MVVLKFETSDGTPLQFDITVIDDGDVLPDEVDLDRENLEHRSLQKIAKHFSIKANQRGVILLQLIKDALVKSHSGLPGQVNDENKRSRPPSSASASASASASPESKILRRQSSRDVSTSQKAYRRTMQILTPNPKGKVANQMKNSATVTATDTNKENETTSETKNNSNQKEGGTAGIESAPERNNNQNEKEGTDTNKENENNNNQKEGETAAVESTFPTTERSNNQNEKEETDTNKENENNNNQMEGETAAADSLLQLSGSSVTNLPKCCSRDYCTMNGTIEGGVRHHCKKCSGPFHGSLCSANGGGPSDDGIGMICFSCQPPERATENKSRNAIKNLSQKFDDAVTTRRSEDSDSDDTAELLRKLPKIQRHKQTEQEQVSEEGVDIDRGDSSPDDQSRTRLSLSSTSTIQTVVEIIDLDDDCSNDLEETSNIQERKKVLVQLDFPHGAVGLHLAIIGNEAPYIKEIKPYCPLRNFLIGGETLVSINGTEVAGKTLNEIKQMFAKLYQGVKTIIFSRYSIMHPPNIKNKKIVKAIKKKTKKGNKAAKEAPQSCAVSSDKVELGHNLESMTAATKARQKSGQKVGNSATEISHFKGRPAEDRKRQLFECFDCYQAMITPVPVVDKKITSTWPKIWNVLIHRDPFMPPNAKGGPRTKDMRKGLRDKPEYYVVAPNMDVIKSAHRILGGLIANETDTDDFAIKFFANGIRAFDASRHQEGVTRTANQRKLVPGCALPPEATKRMVSQTPHVNNRSNNNYSRNCDPENEWDSDDDE